MRCARAVASLSRPFLLCPLHQKLKERTARLQNMGGPAALLLRAKNSSWAAANPEATHFHFLIAFLMSKEGLSFHSDEDEEMDEATQRTGRVRLQHAFRSPLAADIVHELDTAPVKQSTRPGAKLSVGMATKLRSRSDIQDLFTSATVDLVAASSSSRKRKQSFDSSADVERRQVSLHRVAACG